MLTLQNFPESTTRVRQLVLAPIEGQKVKDSRGLTDSRLFSGENKVNAVLAEGTMLWRIKYSIGDVPPALKQEFTTFTRLKDFAERYFNSRGLKIVEVKD